ncbi:hypothetical protein [Aquimarina algicola]|uniref:Uncharacterized protein n=1 Tax=Aquimarina algicola TaxID=2589995 RepID=A0A504J9U7_9FLAO|nr:hypothetical protein [Aquimarina algicola]TPN87414.1 hypothetical protein FHK87_07480 [Aquimarina algicola]
MIAPNLANTALFKCIVYFHDGESRTFYSLDKSHKRAKPNEALGIRRLEKMLMFRFRGTWETAIIYENLPKGKEIAKYKNGIRVL